jgi:hypothetical protein
MRRAPWAMLLANAFARLKPISVARSIGRRADAIGRVQNMRETPLGIETKVDGAL